MRKRFQSVRVPKIYQKTRRSPWQISSPAYPPPLHRPPAAKSRNYASLIEAYEICGLAVGVLQSGAWCGIVEAVTLAIEIDFPDEVAELTLPEGVSDRLQHLLDKQDDGVPLTDEERSEAEGLVTLSDMLSLMRQRAKRVGQA